MRAPRNCHAVFLLVGAPAAGVPCNRADRASVEPRGRAQGSALQPHLVLSTMRTAAAVIAFVACVQAGLWGLTQSHVSAPDVEGPLASISYAPFASSANPDEGGRTTAAQIRADLAKLAPLTRSIRLYSSTGGVELVPGIASEFGLNVTVGAWIDKHEDRNEREIASAIALARRHSNVKSVMVGNETIFRGEQTVDNLIKMIQRVKRATNVPVSTGEIWHVWIEHPELVSQVDFIAAHVLPYWEGLPASQAAEQAVLIYDKLRQAYPGKRIVIAEFGWPSAGYNLRDAVPGREAQAAVLRNFVSRAEAYGIEYNIIEAVDQPWKTFEGGVGPYWGLFDAARHAKFSWTGPITDPDHWRLAGMAILISVLLSLPLVVIALARIEEIAVIAFGRRPRRLITAPLASGTATGFAPKVSIHVPAYCEPPDMLKQTLDAVARLDYPNYECLVVINNTPDPAFWRPIEEHCRELGPRFKFVRADVLSGFKAGALRLALDHTAADAEIIGVIDAGIVVDPNWLKDLVPAFRDPTVGLVQAPQDHRDGGRSLAHYAMNGEYAGFFDIGMVQRNEYNAIVVHGTMCLVRRAALEMAGNWSSDTICEDTDLGLTLLELGWQAHYTNRRYGHGLLPDGFEAYKNQRHRWAYGGFQIIRKHWRRFLPGGSRLSPDQRREFALGWLNWLGAESIGVAVALLNLMWVPVVAFADIAIPDKILTLPILLSFVVSLVHFLVLYRLRVPVKTGQMLGAMIAAMSVQWTVCRAVAQGLITEHLAFARTSKGGLSSMSIEFQAFWEAVIAVLLLAGAAVLVATNTKQIPEIDVFAVVLVLQSLPFLAAVAIATLELSRVNSFAFWRN